MDRAVHFEQQAYWTLQAARLLALRVNHTLQETIALFLCNVHDITFCTIS